MSVIIKDSWGQTPIHTTNGDIKVAQGHMGNPAEISYYSKNDILNHWPGKTAQGREFNWALIGK